METPSYLPEVAAAVEKDQALRELAEPHTAEEKLAKLGDAPPRFREITRELKELTGTWNPVEVYTADPESIATEKVAFFAALDQGEVHNPELTYSHAESMDVDEPYEKLLEMLGEVKATKIDKGDRISRVARAALIAKIKDDMATCEMVRGIQRKDEALIKRAITEKYQPLDDGLLAVAEKTYERDCTPKDPEQESGGLLTQEEKEYLKETKFKAEEIKAAFIWALEEMGIHASDKSADGFQVVIDEKATSIDVRDKSINGPTIFIPTTREVTGKYLLNLLAHEIGSHARQSMNGHRLFEIGGGPLKIDDETLYEGLAMRAERNLSTELFGEDASVASAKYTLGIEIASRGGSFTDIYHRIHDVTLHEELKIAPSADLPPPDEIPEKIREKAKAEGWRVAYRVMRGHTDMSNPEGYAMTKDLAYLRGQEIDRELQEVGLGHLNEAAILDGAGLRLVQEFNLTPDDLPIKNTNLGRRYWEEVLKPQMVLEKLQSAD
jgi:hypothetical protein